MENVADEKYIELICNGEFNAVPDFKIGELFESFFDNINYNVVKENGEAYVDFTGDAFCDDEPCTILIRFKIDSNVEEFEIELVKVNEDILDEANMLAKKGIQELVVIAQDTTKYGMDLYGKLN